MEEVFKSMSIKGRVAYAINCLENCIKFYSYNVDDWSFVLNQLWTFTNIECIDDWCYQTAELLPEAILENDKYIKVNYEFINVDEFYNLHALYQSANDTNNKNYF